MQFGEEFNDRYYEIAWNLQIYFSQLVLWVIPLPPQKKLSMDTRIKQF